MGRREERGLWVSSVGAIDIIGVRLDVEGVWRRCKRTLLGWPLGCVLLRGSIIVARQCTAVSARVGAQ